MHSIYSGQECEVILGDVLVRITGYGASHSCLGAETNEQGVITQLKY